MGRWEGREGFQMENLTPVGDSWTHPWLLHLGFQMSRITAVDR